LTKLLLYSATRCKGRNYDSNILDILFANTSVPYEHIMPTVSPVHASLYIMAILDNSYVINTTTITTAAATTTTTTTTRYRVFLGKLIVSQLARKFPAFLREPEGSSVCSQKPAFGPVKSSPHLNTQFL
jgi:hypothetical protein